MKLTVAGAALLLLGAMSATGCTAASETVAGIRGPGYDFKEVQPFATAREERPLSRYTRFQMVPFTDDMGGRVPREFFEYLPGMFETALAKRGLAGLSGGKTLLVRGKVISYQTQGVGEMLLSPNEQAVARVELVDKASGKVLGVANCIGQGEHRVNTGNKNLARGTGRAIAAWIASRHPRGTAKEED